MRELDILSEQPYHASAFPSPCLWVIGRAVAHGRSEQLGAHMGTTLPPRRDLFPPVLLGPCPRAPCRTSQPRIDTWTQASGPAEYHHALRLRARFLGLPCVTHLGSVLQLAATDMR